MNSTDGLLKRVTRVQIAKYAAASGDFNALHLDDEHAQRAGMPGVIAHGLLTLGFAGQAVTERAGGDPTAVRSISMRFRRPVRPGDTVEVRLEEDGPARDGIQGLLITVLVGDAQVGTGRASIQV